MYISLAKIIVNCHRYRRLIPLPAKQLTVTDDNEEEQKIEIYRPVKKVDTYV
jgi:hypothetical protein